MTTIFSLAMTFYFLARAFVLKENEVTTGKNKKEMKEMKAFKDVYVYMHSFALIFTLLFELVTENNTIVMLGISVSGMLAVMQLAVFEWREYTYTRACDLVTGEVVDSIITRSIKEDYDFVQRYETSYLIRTVCVKGKFLSKEEEEAAFINTKNINVVNKHLVPSSHKSVNAYYKHM